MSDTSAEDGYRTFSVRWPEALVDEIDRRARLDRRPRNQWLEIFVGSKLAEINDRPYANWTFAQLGERLQELEAWAADRPDDETAALIARVGKDLIVGEIHHREPGAAVALAAGRSLTITDTSVAWREPETTT